MTDVRYTPLTVPRKLMEKYETRGPRYTSYPTAPQFKTDFDTLQIESLWEKTNDKKSPLSLYIHLPFCKMRCLYCGCFTETGHSAETKDAYIFKLLKEIQAMQNLLNPSRPVHQLSLGGGSPTSLSIDQMNKLIEGVFKCFNRGDHAEQAVEIDPRSVDTVYLETLAELGFNRFSIGVQDFNADVQTKINRVMDLNHTLKLIDHAKSLNTRSINLDIMYGLPGQNETNFKETLKQILEISPDRIALFGYAHVPWVSPHQKALEKYPIPDTNLRMKLFGLGYEKLVNAGYVPIGMDHFARPDDELAEALRNRTLTRNFMGYTTQRGLDLAGIGASSISSVGMSYTQNLKDVTGYIGTPDSIPWRKALKLSNEDALRREVIRELSCNFYLNTVPIENQFGIDFHDHFQAEMKALESMVDDKLLETDRYSLTVTDLGRFFIRNICMVFDQYLSSGGRGRYSKTL